MIKNIFLVIFSFIRFSLIKLFNFKNFFFSGIQRFSLNTSIIMKNKSVVRLGKRLSVHSGTKFICKNGGKLFIGNKVFFNNNCTVCCTDKIEIGDGTEIGPNVTIYDFDFEGNSKNIVKNPVRIGKNTWIGANATILAGSTVGENCVIGAHAVVKGDYPDNCMIVQNRDTQVIAIK